MKARRSIARLVVSGAVLAAALCAVCGLGWVALDNVLVVHTPEGQCWRFGADDCWDLSPEFVSQATGVALPSGTLVRDSSTRAWLSWRLSATVVLPRQVKLPPAGATPASPLQRVASAEGRPTYRVYLVKPGGTVWPTPH